MKVNFIYDPKRREVQIVSEFLGNIREAFSVKNEAAHFNRFQRFLPQRLYAITPLGYCGIGLVPEIVRYLGQLSIPFEINYDQSYLDLVAALKPPARIDNIKKLNSSLKIRDYQEEAVKTALNQGCGVVVVGTGGGKTLIIATLLNNLNTLGKTLIIVPDIGLVEQTYKDFLSYGIPEVHVTKWTGSNEIDLSKSVIIANLGILQSKISDTSWFKQIGVLIIDECHKIRHKNKVNKLLNKIPSLNRFGFTGTLPENNIDQWNIISQIGPVIYEKTTSDLRELGDSYIANAQALAIHIEYDKKPDYDNAGLMEEYAMELEFIIKNPFRNEVIKRLIERINNNALILVDRIEHGETMYNVLQQISTKEVYFIRGDVEIEARQKIQQIMEAQDNVVCVAISKIFSTGISIKNIHYIVFGAGGKSKIKTLQSIGRGLRIHENKDKLTIVDIVDGLIYGERHFEKRKQYYELEKIEIINKRIFERPGNS